LIVLYDKMRLYREDIVGRLCETEPESAWSELFATLQDLENRLHDLMKAATSEKTEPALIRRLSSTIKPIFQVKKYKCKVCDKKFSRPSSL
jgi:hypothetical protein